MSVNQCVALCSGTRYAIRRRTPESPRGGASVPNTGEKSSPGLPRKVTGTWLACGVTAVVDAGSGPPPL